MSERLKERFPIGTKVQLNDLGRKLMPRVADRTGEVTGYRGDIDPMILWDGQSSPVLNHQLYLKALK